MQEQDGTLNRLRPRAPATWRFPCRGDALRAARSPPPSNEAVLFTIRPLAEADPASVDALLDAAFGADRRRRTAYLLRAGLSPLPHLSYAAFEDAGTLAGLLQSWPVQLEEESGRVGMLILVGPVAVAPTLQRGGLGRSLMERLLDDWDGHEPLVLIGDPEYYGRFFGFTAEATGGWDLPGPVERRRLLARGDLSGFPERGMLGPRR